MGHPKKHRKKYSGPKRPYDKARIEREKRLMREFGLGRKHEIWRIEWVLRNMRRRARELQAKKQQGIDVDHEIKSMLDGTARVGIKCDDLECILEIKTEDMLSRRLQTIVYKKGIANSIMHARQLIAHGHIIIGSRKIRYPSYIVAAGIEPGIAINKSAQGDDK